MVRAATDPGLIAAAPMKTLLLLLLLLVGLGLTGCSAVAVRGPLGTALPPDATNKLIGEWLGPDHMVLTVARDADGPTLTASYVEDGKPHAIRFLVTQLNDDCTILWGEVEVAGFHSPVRLVTSDDDAVVLIVPDQEEIKRRLAAGTLTAAPEKHEELLCLEPAGLLEFLTTKSAWDLTTMVPLVRKPGTAPASPDSPPTARTPQDRGPALRAASS
jgi:hypothetical protein